MPVSLWLRPEAETAAALDAAIAGYALGHGRTLFAAHLTLASGDEWHGGQAALNDFRPVWLAPEGCLEAGTFFQAFALSFSRSPALEALQQQACQTLRSPRLSEYPPHLSLTYGEVDDRLPLLALVHSFSRPVLFDRILVVRYDALDETQAGVAKWRYDEEIRLG
jgi:hypothetical protein